MDDPNYNLLLTSDARYSKQAHKIRLKESLLSRKNNYLVIRCYQLSAAFPLFPLLLATSHTPIQLDLMRAMQSLAGKFIGRMEKNRKQLCSDDFKMVIDVCFSSCCCKNVVFL